MGVESRGLLFRLFYTVSSARIRADPDITHVRLIATQRTSQDNVLYFIALVLVEAEFLPLPHARTVESSHYELLRVLSDCTVPYILQYGTMPYH